jgi:hypothetical protein
VFTADPFYHICQAGAKAVYRANQVAFACSGKLGNAANPGSEELLDLE